jgi:hypothetical protein
MVANHFRWDFIGLSTDEKPTPATSSKVADGSTFYCSDNSKLYIWYKNQWYEKTATGGGGGGGSELPITVLTDDDVNYTNPDDPTKHYIAVWLLDTGTYMLDPEATVPFLFDSRINLALASPAEEQPFVKVMNYDGEDAVEFTFTTAYTNNGYFFSSSETGEASDYYYLETPFIGATDSGDGTGGLVPTPFAGDEDKFLKGDGSWATAGSSVNVVQTTGDSTTDVMSQKATTDMVLSGTSVGILADDRSGSYAVALGKNSVAYQNNTIAIGGGPSTSGSARTSATNAIAIGSRTNTTAQNSIALGEGAKATRKGELNIGTEGATLTDGYNDTQYRVIGGVHDGQLAHDAVTVNQVNSVIDAINTALSTNIPHIGA